LPHTDNVIWKIPGKGVYVGDLRDDKANGQGKWTSLDGSVMRGTFKDWDWESGSAAVTLPNNDLYDGEFRSGVPHGKGKRNYTNHDVFEGEFLNGSIVEGKHTSGNEEYKGPFLNGKRHGAGDLSFKDYNTSLFGDVEKPIWYFHGSFVEGQPHGSCWVLARVPGVSGYYEYEGSFRNGKADRGGWTLQ